MTRRANLPGVDYSLIAHAPWISPACTKSYLASAASDGANGFIFYLIDNSTSVPPTANDPIWGLGDGGRWKSQNKYPVYAVPGFDGALITQRLGQYSGNMTEVWNGHLLTEHFDSRDYVRLYTLIGTGKYRALPSLWVFLLIVLGMLLAIIGLTSSSMHYIQHRRRQTLRRLVASGEVDLEALGIKRLTVPPEVVDKMPLFIYVANSAEEEAGSRLSVPSVALSPLPGGDPGAPSGDPIPLDIAAPSRRNPNLISSYPLIVDGSQSGDCPLLPKDLPHRRMPYSQPTCPICLDDFITHKTPVRELPCGHIYHPECIDPFLKHNSSLCPVCKGKVLPEGHCPEQVTNAMVRRERLIRRMRVNMNVAVIQEVGANGGNQRLAVGRRMASFHRQLGRSNRTNRQRTPSAPLPSILEMGSTVRARNPISGRHSPVQDPTTVSRREMARRRASAFLGHHRTVDDEDREQHARLSKCKPM